MTAIFGDTFYFLALVNRADEAHPRCREFSERYRGAVVTTAYVLVEVADALAGPAHRVAAARFIRFLQGQSQVRIVPASEALLDRGLSLYADRPDKDWSLTDCISFAVMKDAGITEALTGDHHFAQAGFRALFA
jgi:hypothetical protein